jgi:translation initiation factor 4E
MSTLPASFQHANKVALSAALAENPDNVSNGSDTEPGEIQEVDMQAQAEGIRTVFNDPTNFNVKVCHRNSFHTSLVFIFSPL